MIKIDNVGIGERVKGKRRELGMTQEELADKCDVSTSYIGHIERGSTSMSVNTLLLLSRTLNVSTDYLLYDSFSDDDQMLQHIASIIRDKPESKKRIFLVAVRALADKIDEF
ncbi:MAG: helix-turn-helix transcriptional regulator [Clostridia bacterium]|nr:helix-turn-helix transcriptional regulator [Clostridia bacterium]